MLAGSLVDGQGLGLAAGRGQGAHEQPGRALGQLVGGRELAQLADRRRVGGVEREIGLDPVERRGGPELGEAGGGRERERLPRHVGERAAAPLPECRAEQAGRLPRVAPGERLASGAGLGLEGGGIDRFWRHGEPVAGRRRLNHAIRHSRLPERDPQPGDKGLQRVGRVSGPLGRPQPVDKRVGRHHAPRIKGEQDEQRAHPVPAHAHRPARRVAHLERAEHPDPDRVRRRLHVALPAGSRRFQRAAKPMLARNPNRDLSRFRNH